MTTEFGTIAEPPVTKNRHFFARLHQRVADFVARLPARIETKLLAAFSGIVGLLILLGAIGIGVLSLLNQHTEELIDTDREIADYHRLQHDVDGLLVAISTAMWLPGQEYLDRAQYEIQQFQVDLGRLALASGDASAIAEIRRESNRFVDILGRILVLCGEGNTDQVGALLLDQARPSASKLEQSTSRLVADMEAGMAECIVDSHNAYRRAQLVVVGFAFGSILLGIYLGHMISTLIVGPLRHIGARLGRIATGEFNQFVTVPNRDELGALANNVNRTSKQLGELYIDLESEKQRSEDLLLKILPRPIVKRLGNGETLIADDIPEATILFADLAGFTALSSTMVAVEIVEMLDLLFSRFDALACRFGLEKIKTIGDGYMVAGGVPDPRADHAAAVVEMAIAMNEATDVATRALGVLRQPLRVRIGVHSGPLIAGVLGTNKLIYDVWGDTVNIASRMEKYGEPGRIHISAATRALLGDLHRFEARGKIDIKGKGKMETYFLERPIGSHVAAARADGLVIHAPSICENSGAILDPAMAAIGG
jgi:class 3 adenylate cyclase/CHASE3 domain sensor protein